MKNLIIIIGLLLSLMSFAAVENKIFYVNGLKKLKLNNTSGYVKVNVSEDGKVYALANKVKFDKNCKLIMVSSGKDIVVEVKKDGWFNDVECKVNFEIKVPREITMDLKSGSGDLVINGTKGKIDFELGSGDVVIDAEVAKLAGKSGSGKVKILGKIGDTEIKTGSGSIDISGLTGDAKLKTGSGNIKIKYKSATQKGELDIKVGSGDATVFLPSSMKVLTNYISGTGRIYNELGDSSDALFKVTMKAGSGNLNIKKLQ